MKDHINDIIKSESLQEISLDQVEKVLDNNISNEILKEIPILKTLVAMRKMYNSYTDRIFIKKAMNVLLEIGDINWNQRIELVSDLDDEDETGTEKILMAIEQLETTKKCKVYGRLCKLKALKKLNDPHDFLRLTKLIQDAYLDDLFLVTDFEKSAEKEIHEGDYYPLISLGLIYQEPSEQKPIRRNQNQNSDWEPEYIGGEIVFNYRLSDLGLILLKYFYDLFPDDRILKS